MPGEKYPAIIDSGLKESIKAFYDLGFTIVIATGTDGENLDYYRFEFEKAGIIGYIKDFSPVNHQTTDSKVDKLKKYSTQYAVPMKDIYFYDDGQSNVANARAAGAISYRVTDSDSLTAQLQRLLRERQENAQKEDVSSREEKNECVHFV